MAATNFGALTDEQKTVWSMDWWMTARNHSLLNRFMGTGQNSLIQRITELTKTTSGLRAVITLVQDMTGDGTVGDATAEGFEEAMLTDEDVIQIDQLRMNTKSTGRLSDQEGIVKFREEARDKLAYAIGDRCDQIGILVMSGIPLSNRNDGGTRRAEQFDIPGHKLSELAFNSDISAPSPARHVRWDGANSVLKVGSRTGDGKYAGTHEIKDTDKITYKTLVRLKAYATTSYFKGIRGRGNSEMFYLFVSPDTMADLRLDSDIIAHERNAGPRSYSANRLWEGIDDMIVINGIHIIEHRHIYHTTGANNGSKWGGGTMGEGGNVNGTRALFCGAQAMGFVDLDGSNIWEEDNFDYGNQQGLLTGKIFGFKKPKMNMAPYYESEEDFGVIALDLAHS